MDKLLDIGNDYLIDNTIKHTYLSLEQDLTSSVCVKQLFGTFVANSKVSNFIQA